MILEEEMRRSLEYCWWRSRWWLQRAKRQEEVASHVAEGLHAFAVEQSNAEQDRAIRWTTQWAAIRKRAKVVLETQLSNVELQVPLPVLVVELEDDGDDDDDDLEADEEEV